MYLYVLLASWEKNGPCCSPAETKVKWGWDKISLFSVEKLHVYTNYNYTFPIHVFLLPLLSVLCLQYTAARVLTLKPLKCRMGASSRKHISILVSSSLWSSLRTRITDVNLYVAFLLYAEIRYLRLQGYSVIWDKFIYDLLKVCDSGLLFIIKLLWWTLSIVYLHYVTFQKLHVFLKRHIM